MFHATSAGQKNKKSSSNTHARGSEVRRVCRGKGPILFTARSSSPDSASSVDSALAIHAGPGATSFSSSLEWRRSFLDFLCFLAFFDFLCLCFLVVWSSEASSKSRFSLARSAACSSSSELWRKKKWFSGCNQSMNQTINQRRKHLINQSIDQSINRHSSNQCLSNQSINQSRDQSIGATHWNRNSKMFKQTSNKAIY